MTTTAEGHRATAKTYAARAKELRRQAAEYDDVVKRHSELAEKLEGAVDLGHITSMVTNPHGSIYYSKLHQAGVRVSLGSEGDSWEVYFDNEYQQTFRDRAAAEVAALALLLEKEQS